MHRMRDAELQMLGCYLKSSPFVYVINYDFFPPRGVN